MAIRNILKDGDPTLNKQSREVTVFDERLHTLLDDMWETLELANGVGLAAPQVGVLRRVALVLDIRVTDDEELEEVALELISPSIIEADGEQTDYEGCLSIPGLMGMVTRPRRVKVRAQDRFGEWFEIVGEDLTARALCHELDHLDGKLFKRLCDELISTDLPPEGEVGE
ncbi:MAG: peptide deformylase [Oscillospiraceae bacterium]|nr:peptide deformylase [Oscillospiraceae bacterium]